MCNEAYRKRELAKLLADWPTQYVPLRFPEGRPNFAPLDGFRITDRVEIIRPATAEAGVAEMVTRRWSWPAANGKPVYNVRSDGRAIAHASRCLIPVDGFYEYGDAPDDAPPTDLFGASVPVRRGKPLKAKWAFTLSGAEGFAIAGVWRADPVVGEAWAMLTCPPGPDVAPIHDRQPVVLPPADWARWLDPATPSSELCRPLPGGSLTATRER
ncbi:MULTISPECIES: SOS response-associated peptidase family protein [unclassified Sphingomonas]|uniref:SOS response-associated peptidase family protein n=1 Tax=unclassified Sphingomonas TaxID=196159 RepID=UPI002150A37E|nr:MULTISPECIES: SOS response-associated peptidase family protein [unclassified Sphingomonas]MCR5870182.1 SOS response-associated peptidase family protein [Sphingomonas sp. J344]UUX98127.1 SOS response-associated peptidase family protein [Sphingomonas sp. J315]